ncbi:PA0069 family radical SAM protein [Luteimonas terricola]|uniref:Radical SAM protein n=1 Tax=Luteimonas terricola TaxID=645597 RepID=A0ABQ2E4F5_9GAMM|nr:PA0069 family radical SAM protein [Luteimonas terricola]GGJ95412.1 radical SAM protein [Luteimonas terricola]
MRDDGKARLAILGPLKGRGAGSRVAGRFEQRSASREDDGWGSGHDFSDASGEALESGPDTVVTTERARSIISRNQSPDIGFSQSINPYRGCEHGCVYCFARPSHAYLDLSPGLDFETRLFAKTNAAELLRAELARPRYRCSPIALGVNTDAYQPLERRQRITRELLEVLAETRHPVHLITKNALVLRDLDLLAPMARDKLVQVSLSVTTLDNRLAARMEPRASAPHSRLKAIAGLHAAGVPVSVMVAPVIPAITDGELEAILGAAREAGAGAASYVLLRLPHELREIWREWLAQHYPERAAHVMSLVAQMRGGRDYDSAFGTRMRGEGPFAQLLASRFTRACRQLGFTRPPELDCSRFEPPRISAASPQGSLF